jgi:hypothetical protein
MRAIGQRFEARQRHRRAADGHEEIAAAHAIERVAIRTVGSFLLVHAITPGVKGTRGALAPIFRNRRGCVKQQPLEIEFCKAQRKERETGERIFFTPSIRQA